MTSTAGLKAAGYMKTPVISGLQQIDNKWWFITPDGYKFILKGVDAASIWEWGYGTPFKKADGTPRRGVRGASRSWSSMLRPMPTMPMAKESASS